MSRTVEWVIVLSVYVLSVCESYPIEWEIEGSSDRDRTLATWRAAAIMLYAQAFALLSARPLVSRGASRAIATTAAPIKRLLTEEITPDEWAHIIEVLAPFAKASRYERLGEVLSKRRGGLHIVLENVGDPCNVAAILRTAEGLGVQHVHTIEAISPSGHREQAVGRIGSGRKVGKRALSNVAMGAGRWLTLTHYKSPIDCLRRLNELDLTVLASDCPPCESEVNLPAAVRGAASMRAEDFAAGAAQPIDASMMADGQGVALVFGNEARGVSRAFIQRADHAFYLPMVGMTQSFNISVAVAMTLYAVIATGRFPEGSLPEAERLELLGRWLMRDVKAAKQILRSSAKIDLDDF